MYYVSLVTDGILVEKMIYKKVSDYSADCVLLAIGDKQYVVPHTLLTLHVAPVLYVDFVNKRLVPRVA